MAQKTSIKWEFVVICTVIIMITSTTGAILKYNKKVPSNNRLSVAPIFDKYEQKNIQGPDTYIFGYDIEDPAHSNTQFRQEERLPNGTVIGSYGYLAPDGFTHVVNYVADERGYRAQAEIVRRRPMITLNPFEDVKEEINNANRPLNQLEEIKNFAKQRNTKNRRRNNENVPREVYRKNYNHLDIKNNDLYNYFP